MPYPHSHKQARILKARREEFYDSVIKPDNIDMSNMLGFSFTGVTENYNKVHKVVYPQYTALFEKLQIIKSAKNVWNKDWALIVLNLMSGLPCIYRTKDST